MAVLSIVKRGLKPDQRWMENPLIMLSSNENRC